MARRLFLLITILALGLLSCQPKQVTATSTPQTTAAKTSYYVKRIADGDTITVVNPQGVDLKVRFACVDAPEVPHTQQERDSNNPQYLDQFKWGRLARNRLTGLLQQASNRVFLQIVDHDRYGRQVAEVRLPDGTLLQQILAREGLVVLYNQYLKNCPDAKNLAQAEAQAQQRRVGIWSDSKFITPSEWRRQFK